MINNATSFWKFIQKHPVEIPIIQRDYAQGRLGKEYIRRDFLANQKKALDDYLKDDTSVLKLDFVYGTEHNGSISFMVRSIMANYIRLTASKG